MPLFCQKYASFPLVITIYIVEGIMRRITSILLIFGLIMVFFAIPSFADDGDISFKLPFKKLLAEPRADANLVFEFPIDVKLLGISKDRNWYKVSIEYDLLFFGHYKYTGWVYAPIENQIRMAEEEVTKQALNK